MAQARLVTRYAEPAGARATHVLTRTMVTPYFSAKRMSGYRPRIAQRVLCDLLGLPDHETFMAALSGAGGVDSTESASVTSFFGHLGAMVAQKRAPPGDDLISALLASGHPDELVGGLVAYVSVSYLATPSNLSAGIALLAANPGQRDQVVRQARYASADIEIGAVVMKAGDLVLSDHNVIGYDDRVFAEPERFNVTRSPNPHLAFSHGVSYCIGAALARIEPQDTAAGVLRHLPGLRLTIPLEEITILGEEGEDQSGGGIARLAVTW